MNAVPPRQCWETPAAWAPAGTCPLQTNVSAKSNLSAIQEAVSSRGSWALSSCKRSPWEPSLLEIPLVCVSPCLGGLIYTRRSSALGGPPWCVKRGKEFFKQIIKRKHNGTWSPNKIYRAWKWFQAGAVGIAFQGLLTLGFFFTLRWNHRNQEKSRHVPPLW